MMIRARKWAKEKAVLTKVREGQRVPLKRYSTSDFLFDGADVRDLVGNKMSFVNFGESA
jgi:hypothetical protein